MYCTVLLIHEKLTTFSVSVMSEIGSTISNLFGGGKTEETGEVSPEGAPEETAAEVLCD